MKRYIYLITAAVLCLAMVFGLAACGGGTAPESESEAASTAAPVNAKEGAIVIGVPNDTTNEARALLLLEANGWIKLREGAGITATVLDVEENPFGITFNEIEAAQLPNVLKDVDYAVINSNYAIDAGLSPTEDALVIEGSYSAYSNIIAVAEGNEQTDKIKALVAAVESQQVADYITAQYKGAVVSTVENPGDGFDASVDYDALAGQTITVAASPTPHAEILKIAADILAERGVTLAVTEFTDYVQPNNVVESGEFDANYFQHLPYLEDFNIQNGTHIVSAGAIHVEPMGFYGGRQADLSPFQQ